MTKTMDSVLRRKDGIHYRIATPDDVAAMRTIIVNSFVEEPMAKAAGMSRSDLFTIVDRFLPGCTESGHSVVAAPDDDPGHIGGVLMNRDYQAPLPAGILDDVPRFSPVAAALQAVDERYEATRPALESGEALDLWMLGVVPGSPFARRGIAHGLILAGRDAAHQNGFRRCVAECTGRYSQRAAIKAGFVEGARVDYATFQFEGRRIFANIPAPHKFLILYELLL